MKLLFFQYSREALLGGVYLFFLANIQKNEPCELRVPSSEGTLFMPVKGGVYFSPKVFSKIEKKMVKTAFLTLAASGQKPKRLLLDFFFFGWGGTLTKKIC